MNFGSVCSGVEAASLAWNPLGWRALFFAEVEAFPSAVLCSRFHATPPLRPLDPADAGTEKDRKQRIFWAKQLAGLPQEGSVPNLGDFTKIKKGDYDETIDLLVGGTPCQSYSVAGLRKGLADPRGNLALEFVKLAYRTNTRWVVWENVPGVLSSGGGHDFASFLSLLCGWELPIPDGGWRNSGIVTPAPGCFGLAWRVLDAQFTRVPRIFPRAVPQRRRRIFVVAYRGIPRGDSCDWRYPAAVLLDGEVRGRDTPPCRTTEPGVAPPAEVGSAPADGGRTIKKEPKISFPKDGKNRCWWDGGNKAGTLTRTSDQQYMPDKGRMQCVIVPERDKNICFENHAQDARIKIADVSQTISARMGTGGGNLPLVMGKKADAEEVLAFIKNDAGGGRDGYWKDVFPTMRSQVIPAIARREYLNITPCENRNGKKRAVDGFGIAKSDACETGGIIALDGDKIGKKERAGGSGLGVSEEGVMYTQTTTDIHAVAYRQKEEATGGASNPGTAQSLRMLRCEIGAEAFRSWAIGTLRSISLRNEQSEIEVRETESAVVELQKMWEFWKERCPDYQSGQEEHFVRELDSLLQKLPQLHTSQLPVVRRLLPVETERLMGFPDSHTKIPWRKRPAEDCPDAPRYKACGNSMAVNCMAWLGQRIEMVEKSIALQEVKAQYMNEKEIYGGNNILTGKQNH